MKHYAHIITYLVCLASAWLLCSCRSTYQNDSRAKEQSNLSISDSALHTRTGDHYSRFTLNQEEADKGWKIKVNFDTTQPANPDTGLPPISDIEIEGSEKTIKTLLQKDDTTHVSDTQETKTYITLLQDKETQSHKNADSTVAGGIDSGIKYGLIIGIPIVLIILTSTLYARNRQKNPSK